LNFKKITLYKEPALPEIDIKRLTDFLEENFPFKIEIKDNILIITCKYHSYPDREREYIPFRITLREEAFSNIW